VSEPEAIGEAEYEQRRGLRRRLEIALSKVYALAAEAARALGFMDLVEQWGDMARAYADAPAHTARYVERLSRQRRSGT